MSLTHEHVEKATTVPDQVRTYLPHEACIVSHRGIDHATMSICGELNIGDIILQEPYKTPELYLYRASARVRRIYEVKELRGIIVTPNREKIYTYELEERYAYEKDMDDLQITVIVQQSIQSNGKGYFFGGWQESDVVIPCK